MCAPEMWCLEWIRNANHMVLLEGKMSMKSFHKIVLSRSHHSLASCEYALHFVFVDVWWCALVLYLCLCLRLFVCMRMCVCVCEGVKFVVGWQPLVTKVRQTWCVCIRSFSLCICVYISSGICMREVGECKKLWCFPHFECWLVCGRLTKSLSVYS